MKNKIDKIRSQTKTFSRDEFTKLLEKCHNIIRNNDKLDPAFAFDEISKILFLKICYERDPNEEALFSLDHFKKKESDYDKNIKPYIQSEDDRIPYMQFLFGQIKEEFSKDDLFNKNDTIKMRQHSFEQIVKKLEKYNLSDTSDDIKGIAFERFLGRTFRGELGQFFTPRPLVDFMVEILDPKEGETICDPCCGSGGFLIKAFEYVREQIEQEVHQVKQKVKDQYLEQKSSDQINDLLSELNKDLNLKNSNSRLGHLSSKSIFGTDANLRMARTSKMNMIMHGGGCSGLHHNDGLLNVNGIFEGRFDVILTNPPFGARVDKSIKITESDKFKDLEKIEHYRAIYGEDYDKALRQIGDNINKPLLDLFDVGEMSGLTEVLFLERCLRLLKKGGRMGIVLPEGVLNNSNLRKVRNYFEGRAKLLLITSIPQDVFVSAKATVKSSLVFLKKFTEDEEKQFSEAKNLAEKEADKTFRYELEQIENKDIPKKEKNKKLKALKAKIEEEVKRLTKTKFNYQIPIAEAKQAGISTTGENCHNDLVDIAKAFKEYRTQSMLWAMPSQKSYRYELTDGEIKRSTDA